MISAEENYHNGPRGDSDVEAGPLARCWENWRVPLEELSTDSRSLFLRQQIVAARPASEAGARQVK